jgi:hypothetical protein
MTDLDVLIKVMDPATNDLRLTVETIELGTTERGDRLVVRATIHVECADDDAALDLAERLIGAYRTLRNQQGRSDDEPA